MREPYDELPDWEIQARAAYRYNLDVSRRQDGDPDLSNPQGRVYERQFTEEERRESIRRLNEYTAERAREQVAAYYARKAARKAESLARDS